MSNTQCRLFSICQWLRVASSPGLAVASSLGPGARALEVVGVHGGKPDWDGIDRLCGEWRPAALVVGDPMTLEDGDQPARRRARRFAHQLRERYGLPVAMIDERSSSREAAQRFALDRAQGRRALVYIDPLHMRQRLSPRHETRRRHLPFITRAAPAAAAFRELIRGTQRPPWPSR